MISTQIFAKIMNRADLSKSDHSFFVDELKMECLDKCLRRNNYKNHCLEPLNGFEDKIQCDLLPINRDLECSIDILLNMVSLTQRNLLFEEFKNYQ